MGHYLPTQLTTRVKFTSMRPFPLPHVPENHTVFRLAPTHCMSLQEVYGHDGTNHILPLIYVWSHFICTGSTCMQVKFKKGTV